jgi:hypothetical protein
VQVREEVASEQAQAVRIAAELATATAQQELQAVRTQMSEELASVRRSRGYHNPPVLRPGIASSLPVRPELWLTCRHTSGRPKRKHR